MTQIGFLVEINRVNKINTRNKLLGKKELYDLYPLLSIDIDMPKKSINPAGEAQIHNVVNCIFYDVVCKKRERSVIFNKKIKKE